jgi:glycosyltransferase involved in cell wall biosynthesis
MKRCCIVRQGYYPGCVRLRKEALALAARGYGVDVICLQAMDQKQSEVVDGIHFYRIAAKRSRKGIANYLNEYLNFFFRAAVKLSTLYFKKRYAVVQVNTLPDFLVFVTLIPKLFGARVVLDLHEPAPELFGVLFGSKSRLFIGLLKFIEKASIRYADRAITVSEQMKSNYVGRGAPADKIDVVLNVPNLEFDPAMYPDRPGAKNPQFNPQLNRQLSPQLNPQLNPQLKLICHGAILKRYGQDVAIRAVRIARETIPGIILYIMGLGKYEPELVRLAADLNLDGHVRFCGYLPYDEMIAMIADCDIGIVPVRKNAYSDLVHTNKMFEYIAMQKPVIISRTRAVEDFYGTDDSCLKYFASGDAGDLARCIVELYGDPAQREKMAGNAFKKYAAVRWEIAQNDYCSIFEKLWQP